MTTDHLTITPPDSANRLCSHHQGRCAYDESNPNRCPTCHSLWATIESRGVHSCRPA